MTHRARFYYAVDELGLSPGFDVWNGALELTFKPRREKIEWAHNGALTVEEVAKLRDHDHSNVLHKEPVLPHRLGSRSVTRYPSISATPTTGELGLAKTVRRHTLAKPLRLLKRVTACGVWHPT